ncbi:MAG: hypothetical protein JXR51_05270 [Bacteroidales bacterium]|nr:hypothetical protein [Bacteroidales bacterium]MBN2756569.1 hypothetical protein [Bacteroidales bacterium]
METIDKTPQEIANDEHLNLLSIFYFIFGGLTIFGSLILLVYAGILSFFLNNKNLQTANDLSEFPLGIISGVLIGLFVLILAYGILIIIAGIKMRNKQNRVFSMVMGIVAMLSFPLGTTLGIFAIIILSKDTVIEQYRKAENEMHSYTS